MRLFDIIVGRILRSGRKTRKISEISWWQTSVSVLLRVQKGLIPENLNLMK